MLHVTNNAESAILKMSHRSQDNSSDEEYHSAAEEEGMTAQQETERLLRTQLASMAVSEPGNSHEGLEEDGDMREHETESGGGCGLSEELEQGSEVGGDTATRTEVRGMEKAAAEDVTGNEYVTGLDNRFVSEDVTVKGEEVELTEEQMKVW